MPSWNEIYSQVDAEHRKTRHPHDVIRENTLSTLHKSTGRNVLAYYSGWLQKTAPQFGNIVSITDEDKNGFMSCFHGMNWEMGLDLILHSPGGSVAATESIIHYIRSKFIHDIRVFVPQLSMSGGTMIAFCGKEIWMGRHSNLGPIDPQFGSQPASLVISEFEQAKSEILANPNLIHVWRPILEQYQPTYLSACREAIEWSRSIAKNTLIEGMFLGHHDAVDVAEKIADIFLDFTQNKNHGRHIHRERCEEIGLKVKPLEEDQNLQDQILSIHHAFMISLMDSPAAKLIQNHNGIIYGKSVVVSA